MKRFLAFLCSFSLLFQFTIHAEDEIKPEKLYAHAAVLMDANSGRVLYEKNGNETLAMASTTKIMTCILALEEGNINDIVTVSEKASMQPKVHLGMKAKEQYYLKDLLYSLMLESHNDTAVAIAEHIATSTEQFADLMNQKAKQIGCENTYFITPNGLDATDEYGSHSTTARDLAKIMSYCILDSPKKDQFLEITQMANHTFTNVEGNRTFTCSNRNSLLYMMEGIISGKTGFTGKAGYCYVGAVKAKDRTFVVALLACGWPNNKNYKWKDSQKLFNYAIDNYFYREKISQELLPIHIKNGASKDGDMFSKVYLSIKNETDLYRILCRENEKIEMKLIIDNDINAPIKKGDMLGEVYVYINDEIVAKSKVISNENIQEKTFSWYFKCMIKKYFST